MANVGKYTMDGMGYHEELQVCLKQGIFQGQERILVEDGIGFLHPGILRTGWFGFLGNYKFGCCLMVSN